MKIDGEFQIAAPQQRVWDSFWDDATMRAWVPGCHKATWEGTERVMAEVAQSVAQLKAEFAFDLAVAEQDAPRLLRLQGTGEGRGINSSVEVSVAIALAPLGDEATQVSYQSEVRITGRLAMVGEVVLKLKAKDVQGQMVRAAKEALEDGEAGRAD